MDLMTLKVFFNPTDILRAVLAALWFMLKLIPHHQEQALPRCCSGVSTSHDVTNMARGQG